MINLIEKKNAANAAATALQAALNDASTTKTGYDLAKKAMDEAVGAYNEAVSANTRETCMAQDNPLLFALELGFEDRLKSVTKQGKDKTFTVDVEIVQDAADIDIKALHDACIKGDVAMPGNDSRWITFLPTVRKLFGIATAKSQNDESAASAAVDFIKTELAQRSDYIGRLPSILDEAAINADADPFSIGSLTSVLQAMADLMLGAGTLYIPRKYTRMLVQVLTKFGTKYTFVTVSESTVALSLYRTFSAAVNKKTFAMGGK